MCSAARAIELKLLKIELFTSSVEEQQQKKSSANFQAKGIDFCFPKMKLPDGLKKIRCHYSKNKASATIITIEFLFKNSRDVTPYEQVFTTKYSIFGLKNSFLFCYSVIFDSFTVTKFIFRYHKILQKRKQSEQVFQMNCFSGTLTKVDNDKVWR